jgi:hypothetical protein
LITISELKKQIRSTFGELQKSSIEPVRATAFRFGLGVERSVQPHECHRLVGSEFMQNSSPFPSAQLFDSFTSLGDRLLRKDR